MQYLDPERCELRWAPRLRRRLYHNAGPNVVWHVDGYDKLKPYGFPIHGCIDGWSRKVLWLTEFEKLPPPPQNNVANSEHTFPCLFQH